MEDGPPGLMEDGPPALSETQACQYVVGHYAFLSGFLIANKRVPRPGTVLP